MQEKDFDADENIKKIPLKNYNQMAYMLFKNRIDAIAGTQGGIYKAVVDIGFSKDDLGDPLILKTTETGVYFSKQNVSDENKKVREAIKAAVIKLKAQGVFGNIMKKWYTK